MPLPEDVVMASQANIAVNQTLDTENERLEQRLQESLGGRPEHGPLTTVPGRRNGRDQRLRTGWGSIEKWQHAPPWNCAVA